MSYSLRGLRGLGTDIAEPFDTTPSSTVQFTTDPNAYIQPADASAAPMTAVPVSPATMPPMPMSVPNVATGPKKGFFSFLETTKPDGTVTGPLGFSWTTWIIGAGVVALVAANRNQEDAAAPAVSTPNKRSRRGR